MRKYSLHIHFNDADGEEVCTQGTVSLWTLIRTVIAFRRIGAWIELKPAGYEHSAAKRGDGDA